MNNIKIKVKLKAYTKGLIPTKVSQLENDEHYVKDLEPNQTGFYVRRPGEWVNVEDSLIRTQLSTPENSGLNVIPDGYDYILSVRKEDIKQTELPSQLQPDTTYYVLDLTANNYIDGGTAFSNGDNEYAVVSDFNYIMTGGTANSIPNIFMQPLNSQGVYNG